MDSACLAFCSTIRIGTPARLMSCITLKISPRNLGESPAVGSSTRRILGFSISALPMATIWRWPPDRVPATWRRFSASGGNKS